MNQYIKLNTASERATIAPRRADDRPDRENAIRSTPYDALTELEIVIWRFSDGNPGHDAQSTGLVNALAEQGRVRVINFSTADLPHPLWSWLAGRFPAGETTPPPDLIIGAGRRTHLPMLAARRAYGGRVVVIMKPDLPRALFDLCIIPEHDGVPASAKVITTRGSLNTMVRSYDHDPGHGLFLVGGPSTHYDWDNDAVVSQVRAIAEHHPQIRWVLTTSRRTPVQFLDILNRALPDNLEIVPFAATPPGWVVQQLRRAGQVWVSEDSVTMVHEALSSGAAVGLIEAPIRRESRVVRGCRKLVDDGLVVRFSAWQSGQPLCAWPWDCNEAARCAAWLYKHWLFAKQGQPTLVWALSGDNKV